MPLMHYVNLLGNLFYNAYPPDANKGTTLPGNNLILTTKIARAIRPGRFFTLRHKFNQLHTAALIFILLILPSWEVQPYPDAISDLRIPEWYGQM